MNDLLMLIAMVIASVGVAALILMLSEIIIITVPVMLTQAVKGNSAPSVPTRQRSTDQNKSGSCPFC
jgi:hypothetical protein